MGEGHCTAKVAVGPSLALYGASRLLICAQASEMAPPYRSEEADAAVGLAFGTLSVAVSAMKTLVRGIPRSCAAACNATAVHR